MKLSTKSTHMWSKDIGYFPAKKGTPARICRQKIIYGEFVGRKWWFFLSVKKSDTQRKISRRIFFWWIAAATHFWVWHTLDKFFILHENRYARSFMCVVWNRATFSHIIMILGEPPCQLYEISIVAPLYIKTVSNCETIFSRVQSQHNATDHNVICKHVTCKHVLITRRNHDHQITQYHVTALIEVQRIQ